MKNKLILNKVLSFVTALLLVFSLYPAGELVYAASEADNAPPEIANVDYKNKGYNSEIVEPHQVYHGDSLIITIDAVDESELNPDGASLTIVPFTEQAGGDIYADENATEIGLSYKGDGRYEGETDPGLDVGTYVIRKITIYDEHGNVDDEKKADDPVISLPFTIVHHYDYDHPISPTGTCPSPSDPSMSIQVTAKCIGCDDQTEPYTLRFPFDHIAVQEHIPGYGTAPTCNRSGYGPAKYRCPICGGITDKLGYTEPLGHIWDKPDYSWSSDNSTVTAEHFCKREIDGAVCGERDFEDVTPTLIEEIPATTEKVGKRVYIAEFSNAYFRKQRKVEIIPKLDPSESQSSEDPSGDNSGSESSAVQNGADGTPVGPGASAEAAERAITNMVTDDDPQGTVFGKLTLRSPKQTKTSINLSWTKVNGAVSYVIFGNKCGKGNKPMKMAVVNGNKQTVSTVANQKVAKGTYYKFIVVALDKDNKVVSTSKVIHVATKGGKVGNHKKVTVKSSVVKKAKKLKAGKSLKLKAKAVPQAKKLKVKKHVAVRYESTDNNVATVTNKGTVKGRNKGTCYVYAYAQNGVFKKIKVTVK